MSITLNNKLFIITDNFYPKKICNYDCYTLTNVNFKCKDNDVFVFKDRKTANRFLSVTDKSKNYHVKSIDDDDLENICNCFNLMPIYV